MHVVKENGLMPVSGDSVRNHTVWKKKVTYRQSVDGIARGGHGVRTMWEKVGADQFVVLNESSKEGKTLLHVWTCTERRGSFCGSHC